MNLTSFSLKLEFNKIKSYFPGHNGTITIVILYSQNIAIFLTWHYVLVYKLNSSEFHSFQIINNTCQQLSK